MELFYKKLDIHIQNLNEKFRAKYVIKKHMYDDIILVLHDGWGDPQFKYWAQKHFKLVKNGHVNIVYSSGKVSRPVVTYEDLYGKLYECHNHVGHHGRDKTWQEVKARYSWVRYDVVMIFIKLCDSCNNQQIFSKSSISYLTRIQVDFIDMSCRPDGKFKWILHVKDHFSKFSWAYPLESKEAECVAEKLLNQFYIFGPPCIVQNGNGKEFTARIIRHIRKTWTDLVIINGKTRHPQTQRLVEHDNHILKTALEKWMQLNHTDNWSKGLGPVLYANNSNVVKITNKTPYEIVFKQGTKSDFELWTMISQSGVEDEENLPDNVIHQFDELHHSDISGTGTGNDSNDLENNNHLNTFDLNNQTFHRTLLSQSSTQTAIPNITNIADTTLAKTFERTNIACSSNFLHLNDNTIAQDISIVNNDRSLRHSITDATVDISNHRLKKIRHETESDYLKSMTKRPKLYDNTVQHQEYQLGDLVGLQINRVNRTNIIPSILPCKVISIHLSSNNLTVYKMCTLKGVLSTLYGVQDLLDLRKCDFANLRSVDPTPLPTITFAQACEEYIAEEINLVTQTCNCNGKCVTYSCSCKAKSIRCCTKCHPKKKHACDNI